MSSPTFLDFSFSNGLPHQRCVSLLTYRRCIAPGAFSLSFYANEKFGVIFTSSCHLALRALALLPARAWRDSRLHLASENPGPRKPVCYLSRWRLCGLVSLWESVRRLCASSFCWSDTIVQCAACLTSSSLTAKEGRYHSIPITLARQAVQLFLFYGEFAYIYSYPKFKGYC